MNDFDSREQFEDLNAENGFGDESLAADNDLVMEQILDNINNTPIGQVLKKIGSLPEVSQKRILGLRQEITKGSYDLNNRLDVALDRVLEELTT